MRVVKSNQPGATRQRDYAATGHYAGCTATSKNVRPDIDEQMIHGRSLDDGHTFLPNGLSLVHELVFLSAAEKRFLNQVQGRTFANVFGLLKRIINVKVAEISRQHCCSNQIAPKALARICEEELKHQDLCLCVEDLAAECMPEGYVLLPDADEMASLLMGKSPWAVLGLTCRVGLIPKMYCREASPRQAGLSPLFADVFCYLRQAQAQRSILDERRWRAEDARLSCVERDQAVDDLIALVVVIDGILQAQRSADAEYFLSCLGRNLSDYESRQLHSLILKAYRRQYIISNVQELHFNCILSDLVTSHQLGHFKAKLGVLA